MNGARILLLMSLGLPGCAAQGTMSTGDLRSPDDLGMPMDLAATPDLASQPDLAASAFCKGTKVAGTCAQAFFATVDACWKPTGPCMIQMAGMGFKQCWQSGDGIAGS